MALEEPLVDEVVEVADEELLPEEEEEEEEEVVGVLKREVAARKADELDGGASRELELWLSDAVDEEVPVLEEELELELEVEVVVEPLVLREAAVLMDPKLWESRRPPRSRGATRREKFSAAVTPVRRMVRSRFPTSTRTLGTRLCSALSDPVLDSDSRALP